MLILKLIGPARRTFRLPAMYALDGILLYGIKVPEVRVSKVLHYVI
ncbi:MAG: hypothetical protein NVS2B7_34830 [Herpetosiphon sp.]